MRDIIRKFLAVLFLVLAAYFAWTALQWDQKYQEGKEEYEELADQNTTQEAPKETSTPQIAPYMEIDWNSLKSQNSDLVGWLVMDPSVNYPVVQAEDNAYYLHRGFHKSYNINGCIFLSAANAPDLTDQNTIVYGHNMRNGTMFGNNRLYQEKKYVKKHPYFYFYTEEGRYIYQIYNTMTVPDASFAYQYVFEKESDFENYLKQAKNNSTVSMKENWPDPSDSIMTLSTCTAQGRLRFVIQGKLIQYEEKAD